MYQNRKSYAEMMSGTKIRINIIGGINRQIFFFLFLQQYCCYLENIIATIRRTIVDKCTKIILMDFSRTCVLYNSEESSSERSPFKNVSGIDRIRLTFGYSRPIRNSHFTMTIKKKMVQQLLQR